MTRRKQWKGIEISYPAWSDINAGTDESLICLTAGEVALILAGINQFRWRTRWIARDESFDQLEFVDNLEAKLMAGTCCDKVLECIIGGGGDVGDIYNENITNIINGDPNAPLITFDTCNADEIYGATTALVDYVNQTLTDFFEILEVATNFIEILAEFLGNLPFPKVKIPAYVVDYLSWLQDNIAENYAANFTVALRDTYRCDYLCLIQSSPNCEMLLAYLIEYHLERLNSSSFFDTLGDMVDFLVLGIWTSTDIVDAAFAGLYGFMLLAISQEDNRIFGAWFAGLKLKDLASFMAIGALTPDPSHSVTCVDPCPSTWCQNFDFGNFASKGWYNWDISTQSGNQYVGVTGAEGWQDTQIVSPATRSIQGIAIEYELPATADITTLTVDRLAIKSSTADDFHYGIRIDLLNSMGATLKSFYSIPNDLFGDDILTAGNSIYNPTENVKFIRVTILTGQDDIDATPQNGSALIRNIKINGVGSNPFVGIEESCA